MIDTFGKIYSFTSFGESHGAAIGGVIEGLPSGIAIDEALIQAELDRRRPGQSAMTTSRREPDRVEILSGLYEGVTTGAPIGFIIRNSNARSGDYDRLKGVYRPSHADYAWTAKYGIRDHRGGGRTSARETAVRVVAGAVASQILATLGIGIRAYTHAIGPVSLSGEYLFPSREQVEASVVRCPDARVSAEMEAEISKAVAEGDSRGGVVACVVKGVPAGLGEPVYGKLSAMLASAMFSINACKGFEIGDGFALSSMEGHDALDIFNPDFTTRTNHSGGIQGGISNGMPLTMRVAFKPVATLGRKVEMTAADGSPVVMAAGGRHDPCVVPRAVPVVEAMAACTLLDAWLLNNASRL